jgi:poly-gamma-glutamate capsule biosynthesis protein CapA/YwtB (metallophosphatase superfamily)
MSLGQRWKLERPTTHPRRGRFRQNAQSVLVIVFLLALPRGPELGASSQEFNLTLAGDSMIQTPATAHQSDPQFMAVASAIRQGDAAYTNLELTFPTSPNAYPGGGSRGGWLPSNPAMLKELQWVGFNLFGAANNHSLDFGVQGLLDTIQVLKGDGVVYAGIGQNLGQARAPGYLSTPHGRVALITCASTFPADSPAGQARPDLQGRPGINPLRHDTRYHVDETTFEALRKLKQDLQLPGPPEGAASSQTLSFRFPAFSIYPISVVFEVSSKPGVITTPDPKDVAAITHSIQDARELSDYVVVSIHAHEGAPGKDSIEAPAQFLVQFAHAAIDAGADVLAASGPHVLRGIEIYKGKVILYSLGNFISQNWIAVPQPTEFYETFGLGLDALPSEAYDARSDHDRRDEPANPLYWQSVIARVVFRGGRPAEVILTPITLGFGRRSPDRGYPEVADPAAAKGILERVQKLSQPFGTNIAISNNQGTITIER